MATPPDFVPADAQQIITDLVARYERITGKTLYPGHVDRAMLDVIAYVSAQKSAEINDTGRLNLVEFSRAPILDYLGELVGCTRLAAQPARTTLRFTLPSPAAANLIIPAGTGLAVDVLVFRTVSDALLLSGQLFVDVPASCEADGPLGNGWLAGQIITPLNPLPLAGMTASNITVSAGGADAERDDRYRARIKLAPEAFSTAGPAESYRYWALSAHASIADVEVRGPDIVVENGALVSRNGVPPGVVEIYPLTTEGVPDDTVLDAVRIAVSAEKRRPLCDLVDVRRPSVVNYAILARAWLYRDADADTVLAAMQAAAAAFVEARRMSLGRDIVPKQAAAALMVPGVYDIELLTPTATVSVPRTAWSACTGISIEVAGLSDG